MFPVAERDATDCLSFAVERERLLNVYLPNRETCDLLIDEYCHSVLPLVPVLTRLETMKKYNDFWQRCLMHLSHPDVSRHDNNQYFTVIFAMLYCASVSRNARLRYVPGEARLLEYDPEKAQMTLFLQATEAALQICEFPKRPTLTSLLAAVLLQTCRPAETATSGVAVLALLIRTAQIMGLHRDPALFKSDLQDGEIRLRRSLWWHLMYLDSTSSLTFGLPSSIQPSSHDVRLPSTEGLLDEDALYILGMNGVYESVCASSAAYAEFFKVRCVPDEIIEQVISYLQPSKEAHLRRVREIALLTFAELSESADISKIRFMQLHFTCMMSIVFEKSIFTLLHYSNRLKWNSPAEQTKLYRDEASRKRWEELVQTALKTTKLYSTGMEDMRHPELLWHLLRFSQFKSIIIVLRDVCYYPTRHLWVEFEEALQRAGISKDRFVEGKDERLQLAKSCMDIHVMMRFNDNNAFAKSQWSKLEKLYAMAERAVNSAEKRARQPRQLHTQVSYISETSTATASGTSADSSTAAGAINTPLSDYSQDMDADYSQDMDGLWMDVENAMTSIKNTENVPLFNDSPQQCLEQFFSEEWYSSLSSI